MKISAKTLHFTALLASACGSALPIQNAQANDKLLFTPESCYPILKPGLEVTPETLKKIHERLLNGNDEDYQVVMESTLDAQGMAVSHKVISQTDIDELNEAAITISKVSPVKCKGALPKVVRDSIDFALDYAPGDKDRTVKARPVFTRSVVPVELVGAPLDKQLANGICAVGKYNDETGEAEDVDCSYDGYCTVVGELVTPKFPKRLQSLGYVGKLQIGMKVNKAGIVEETKANLSSGIPAFDEAARNAAAKTNFQCTGSKPLALYGIVYVFKY